MKTVAFVVAAAISMVACTSEVPSDEIESAAPQVDDGIRTSNRSASLEQAEVEQVTPITNSADINNCTRGHCEAFCSLHETTCAYAGIRPNLYGQYFCVYECK